MADLSTPDLCIIGGGTAGLAAAGLARQRGASVVLVERGTMGGQGFRSGSAAARALAASAARAQLMRRSAPFGIADAEPKIAFRGVHDHVQSVLAALAPEVSPEHIAAQGIEIVAAEGSFIDQRTLRAGDRLIRASSFLIATGATTAVPAIDGLAEIPYFTAESIFGNTRKLSHLVILGEGGTALEIAQAYRRLGSDVTLIASGSALPGTDPELAAIALGCLREEGVVILENAVASVQPRSQGIGLTLRSAEREDRLDASHILVCGSRLPNLDALALDKARIRRDAADATRLALGPTLRTSNPRVFAIGDAAGNCPSGHIARHQARLVIDSLLLGRDGAFAPETVPMVAFTDPPIAEIGLDEAAARARFKSAYRVLRWSFAPSHRALAERQAHGLAKLVLSSDGRIVGAGIVGEGADELIALFALAISRRMHARDLTGFVAPYPSIAEIAGELGQMAVADEKPSALRTRLAAFKRLLP